MKSDDTATKTVYHVGLIDIGLELGEHAPGALSRVIVAPKSTAICNAFS